MLCIDFKKRLKHRDFALNGQRDSKCHENNTEPPRPPRLRSPRHGGKGGAVTPLEGRREHTVTTFRGLQL